MVSGFYSKLALLISLILPSFGATGGTASEIIIRGLEAPAGVAIDEAGHRLFVSESSKNRVLVYNLNVNNELLGDVADFVLGQPNFTNTEAFTTISGLNNPRGIAFLSGNRLAVADYGNNRIVVYDTTAIQNGEPAVLLLGQQDFNYSIVDVSATGMRGPQSVAYLPEKDRLFVADTFNSRVLVFDNISSGAVTGRFADYVLGQTDFERTGGATTNLGVRYPSGVAVDSVSKKLFVADSENNRVLVFDAMDIYSGKQAVGVLGQTDFLSNGGDTSDRRMTRPMGLAVSPGKHLWVADSGNNRILVFKLQDSYAGEPAFDVYGQGDFMSFSGGDGEGRLALGSLSLALAADASSNTLYVPDDENNRIVVFKNIRLVTRDLQDATTGRFYEERVSVAHSDGSPKCFIAGGVLPLGIILEADNHFCVIRGTPTLLGNYNFVIQAENAFALGSYVHKKDFKLRVVYGADYVATTPTAPLPEIIKKSDVVSQPIAAPIVDGGVYPKLVPPAAAPVVLEEKPVQDDVVTKEEQISFWTAFKNLLISWLSFLRK